MPVKAPLFMVQEVFQRQNSEERRLFVREVLRRYLQGLCAEPWERAGNGWPAGRGEGSPACRRPVRGLDADGGLKEGATKETADKYDV